MVLGMKTPMGAIVRRAKIEDAEGIAELSGQLGYPATTDESAERLAEIDANEEHRVLVAEDKGRLLGWVHVCLPHSLLRDRQAEVVGLVIEEKHKGRGIGRALMKHAEHWAKEMGCNSVRLRSNAARLALSAPRRW